MVKCTKFVVTGTTFSVYPKVLSMFFLSYLWKLLCRKSVELRWNLLTVQCFVYKLYQIKTYQ